MEDPRGLRSGKSPYCSPRGSLSMEVAQRFLRKNELRERSYSDDTQSDSGSPELCFLHPDHAWHVNSRRGSSQSEQLEVEPYELNRDYSRSLPGSRRSSFQSQCGTDSKRKSIVISRFSRAIIVEILFHSLRIFVNDRASPIESIDRRVKNIDQPIVDRFKSIESYIRINLVDRDDRSRKLDYIIDYEFLSLNS